VCVVREWLVCVCRKWVIALWECGVVCSTLYPALWACAPSFVLHGRYSVGPHAVGVFDAANGKLLATGAVPVYSTCLLPALTLDGVLVAICGLTVYGYVFRTAARVGTGCVPLQPCSE
jgi:hypothetical protein